MENPPWGRAYTQLRHSRAMEFLLPAGADARTLLGERLRRARRPRAQDSTAGFYDTFDGRLHADGVTLRHVDGRIALLDRASGDELASAEATAAPPAVHGRPARAVARAPRRR